jgi:hypothetical protein
MAKMIEDCGFSKNVLEPAEDMQGWSGEVGEKPEISREREVGGRNGGMANASTLSQE